MTVQSPDPVQRWVPLGWNATDDTQSACPYPHIINYPFGDVHNFHVESSDPVAIMSFFGENATAVTAYKWPLYVLFCWSNGFIDYNIFYLNGSFGSIGIIVG